jgi:hypothetical protein
VHGISPWIPAIIGLAGLAAAVQILAGAGIEHPETSARRIASDCRFSRPLRSSADVPTVAGHGLHLYAGDSEELADLGGVFDDMQWNLADNYSVQHAVVTMG